MGMIGNPQRQSCYRAKVRCREFELIICAIKKVIDGRQVGTLKILEFGCGSCESAEYLSELGDLVVTDVKKSASLCLPPTVEFRIADIYHTDFREGQFDVVLSSQVLEHLEDMEQAFHEMKRISTRDAYYVFSVPTATWLVLSTPAKIFKKLENLFARMCGVQMRPKEVLSHNGNNHFTRRVRQKWLDRFRLGGHGCYPRFCECFKAFRVRNWQMVLELNGFEVITQIPLLTYADSDVPIIPPNRLLARLGLASSYLFICRKAST